MGVQLVLFMLGVIILLYTTKQFVSSAVKISQFLQISPLIIGATIVSLGTSLPELMVSIVAIYRHDSGLAFGNIIGSNISNILLVFPVGILIGQLRIGTVKTQRNALILVGVTVLFFILYLLHIQHFIAGLLIISLGLFIMVNQYTSGVHGRNHEDMVVAKKIKKIKFTHKNIPILILSVLGILFGATLVVTTIENISRITGYSTTILGLSVTSIATSLPELLTTIFSQRDHQEKMTIGTIIGSNIYNLLFIGGLLLLFSPIYSISSFNWMWLFGTTGLFFGVIKYYSGKKIPRLVGALILPLFIVYLLTLTKFL